MFDLFGSELPLAARFFIAFLVVLALIGLVAWLVRRFGSGKLNTAARGRQPRLAVIDAAAVDARRRLVLIRRDNIEHLLMIGGPTDLVVEPNIVRAVASREVARESARIEPTVPRPAPAIESSSPLQPSSEPLPPQRAYRPPTPGEPWHSPEPGVRIRSADSLTGLAAELSTRLTPPESSPPLRQESAPPRASATAELQPDHNLAEMAQQLEAALRRAPVTDPLAVPATAGKAAPRAYAEPKPEAKVEPKFEPKLEPKIEPKLELKIEAKPESKFEPKPEVRFETKFESKPEAKPEPAPTSGKTFYDNLEEEMASLLGRPSGKS